MRLSIAASWLILLAVPGGLFCASGTSAEPPYPVPYSGQLLEAGQPVTGSRWFNFGVYGTSTGGSPLYTQAESLAVVGGVYHTQLNTGGSLWDGSDRWIGVSVGGGPEFVPRIPVGWVPYAVHTPRPSPQLFTAFVSAHTVNGDAWVATDSMTFTVTVPGVAIVNTMGAAQWTGAVSAPPLTLALSRSFPADWDTYVLGRSDVHPVSLTKMESLAPGTYTYYVWGRVVAVGQSYNLMTTALQATFIPE